MTIRLFSKGQKDLTEKYLKHCCILILIFIYQEEKWINSDGMQSAGVTNFFRLFKTIENQGQVCKNKRMSSMLRN